MHHVSPFFNVIIIFVILSFVIKALKKFKANNPDDNVNENKSINKGRYENYQDKQIKNINAPREKTQDAGNITIPPSYEKKIEYANKLTDKDKLQLKRCSNCGGEIPLTMMKCTICGQRQAGCGWVAVFIFIFIALIFVMAIAKDSGFPIMFYLQQIFKF